MSIFPSYIIKSPDGKVVYYNQIDYVKKMIEYSREACKSKMFLSWCRSKGIINPVSSEEVNGKNAIGTKELYLRSYLTECGFHFEEI